MVNILFLLNPLPFLKSATSKTVDITAGVVCVVCQTLGVPVFTTDTINEAIRMEKLARSCLDQLPLREPASANQQIKDLMQARGKDAISQSQALMEKYGVEDTCVSAFGVVCAAAHKYGAVDLIAKACAFMYMD